MSHKENQRASESALDRRLEELLEESLAVDLPEGLIERTMRRLPETQRVSFPWWAWAAYVSFFAISVTGLVLWQWNALVSAVTSLALMGPKLVVLAAAYPYVALIVAGAFLLDTLVVWFLAADLVLRKRLAGAAAS